MGHGIDTGPPAWMPAWVGSAHRRAGATESDLVSGAAFRSMLESLAKAASVLDSDNVPRGGIDQAAGYRHLLVLLALGIDEALRSSDPYDPHVSPANVDAVLKWGMDCPDAAYSGAAIRADATYRVRGRRGTARYVGLQVMAGMAATANVVLDEIDRAEDGSFEITLGSQPQDGNWMKLTEGANSLVVRQFFYDWENEVPATLEIECVERPKRAKRPKSPSPDGVANQLVALGEFVEASTRFWLDIEEAGRAQGLNVFREPLVKTDIGGAAESVTVWGSWDLSEDEALVIEVAVPRALYWSVALGNYWWETIDYAQHQSSLNGFQAAVDEDGVFRAVVAHRDPGVANWLDTGGHRQGPAIFRWVRAESAPVPTTRVVGFEEVTRALPPGIAMVDSASREKTMAGRRAGVRRRFAR